MPEIYWLTGGEELLDRVKPLWEELNVHHRMHSPYFADRFAHFTFDQRMGGLLSKAHAGALRIDLVIDNCTSSDVGYCMTTLDGEGVGEVESLYLEPEYRKFGLGDALMERALTWLTDRGAKKTILGVAWGNEEVLGFYARYGFYPRTIILEQKPQESPQGK
jgi:GNAT superfamily N-acetyltransferase